MVIMIHNSEVYNGVVKYRRFKWHVPLLLAFFKIVKLKLETFSIPIKYFKS